jgi:tRNA modification GTPase
VGPPNAGKSTVFNKLLQFERAIVTATAGTTRDTLSETIIIGGVPVVLTDTAGIRESADVIENIGLARTRTAMADADLLLVVLDGSVSLQAEDLGTLDLDRGIPQLVVLNKADLPTFRNELEGSLNGGVPVIEISARKEGGLGDLREAIIEPFYSVDTSDAGLLITDARHYDLLSRTRGELELSERLIGEGMTEELILSGLHSALRFLGGITGETTAEDVLSQIFATFCIGK